MSAIQDCTPRWAEWESKWRFTTVKKGDANIKYIEDIATGDLYAALWDNDNFLVVAGKCLAIFLGSPIYTLGVVLSHLIRIPIAIGRIAMAAFRQFGQDVEKVGVCEALKGAVCQFFSETSKEVIKDLGNVFRSIYYGFRVQIAAFYGIGDPFEGRKWLVEEEYAWHQISYKHDFRYTIEKIWRTVPTTEECYFFKILEKCFASIGEIFTSLSDSQVLYLSFCFQKRGNKKG